MKLLEKILIPVDVNKSYNDQLEMAIKLAKEYNSEILLMYVLPESSVHIDIKDLVINSINKSFNKALETLKKEGIATSQPIIEFGNPADKILQKATEEKANLILIGSGDKGDSEKFKLGITAEKLMILSDVPMWVVKPNQEAKISNILCPVDFSNQSKRAMKNAVLLSNSFKATLRVLAVYEPFMITSPRLKIDLKKENEALLKQTKKEMEEFLKEFDLKKVHHIIDIKAGEPHEKILDTINEHECDLLVMGTNGRSGFSKLMMGSVTEKVTREVPCSFITTKTLDMFQLRFDNEIKEIEIHFQNANDLVKSGLYKDAINQLLICLQINDMHIPSMYKLAEVYKILGHDAKVDYYEKMAKDLLQRLWDKKIEYEIRNHYRREK